MRDVFWVFVCFFLAVGGQHSGAFDQGFESLVAFLLMVICMNTFRKEKR